MRQGQPEDGTLSVRDQRERRPQWLGTPVKWTARTEIKPADYVSPNADVTDGLADAARTSLTLPGRRRGLPLGPGWVVAEDLLGCTGPEVPVEYFDAVRAEQPGMGDSAGVAELEQFMAERRDVIGEAH